jgi:hypothetical protein
MDRACSTNGEKRNAYRILVGKPEGKRPLGRPRRRWVDDIEMVLREIGWYGMDWIDLAEGRDHHHHFSICKCKKGVTSRSQLLSRHGIVQVQK